MKENWTGGIFRRKGKKKKEGGEARWGKRREPSFRGKRKGKSSILPRRRGCERAG